MFSEVNLRAAFSRRSRILLTVMYVALSSSVVLLAVANYATRKLGLHPLHGLVIFVLAIAVIFVPMAMVQRYVRRFSTICPFCHGDITQSTQETLATKCCPKCGVRIVEGGRAHESAAYQRLRRIESRAFLKYWLWSFPLLAACCLAYHSLNPLTFRQCPQVLLFLPLVGTVAAGWSWVRTFDRRYFPQFDVALSLLTAGAKGFWRAW